MKGRVVTLENLENILEEIKQFFNKRQWMAMRTAYVSTIEEVLILMRLESESWGSVSQKDKMILSSKKALRNPVFEIQKPKDDTQRMKIVISSKRKFTPKIELGNRVFFSRKRIFIYKKVLNSLSHFQVWEPA